MPSTLRGVKPTAVSKRLKMFLYGDAGVGKTMAAIRFPRPYVIDCERGCEVESYAKTIEGRGGVLYQTNRFADVVAEARALNTEDHTYQTLVIDPLTSLYDDELESAEKRVGTEWGKHFGEVRKSWKRLVNIIARLDMNVVVTAHSKALWTGEGDARRVIGRTFDGPKGADYLFDLVVLVELRGSERVGIVKKSRFDVFGVNNTFPFSYDEIARRFGRGQLEREAVPVELVSPELASSILKALDDRDDGDDLLVKALDLAKADDIAELPVAIANRLANYIGVTAMNTNDPKGE